MLFDENKNYCEIECKEYPTPAIQTYLYIIYLHNILQIQNRSLRLGIKQIT